MRQRSGHSSLRRVYLRLNMRLDLAMCIQSFAPVAVESIQAEHRVRWRFRLLQNACSSPRERSPAGGIQPLKTLQVGSGLPWSMPEGPLDRLTHPIHQTSVPTGPSWHSEFGTYR